MAFRFEWIAQPLWIAKESEILERSRINMLLFWNHFDVLFISFFISFMLGVGALVFAIRAAKQQPPVSPSMNLQYAYALVLLGVAAVVWMKLPSACWTDPLWEARNGGPSVRPCKIISAKYLYEDEPGLLNRLSMKVKVEVEFDVGSGDGQVSSPAVAGNPIDLGPRKFIQISPRLFRKSLISQKYPIDGWVWFNSKTRETALLGFDENQIDKMKWL